jgi:hypothetical protein
MMTTENIRRSREKLAKDAEYCAEHGLHDLWIHTTTLMWALDFVLEDVCTRGYKHPTEAVPFHRGEL